MSEDRPQELEGLVDRLKLLVQDEPHPPCGTSDWTTEAVKVIAEAASRLTTLQGEAELYRNQAETVHGKLSHALADKAAAETALAAIRGRVEVEELRPIPDNQWIADQAQQLSASKARNDVGALAWNMAVAFSRWSKQRSHILGDEGSPGDSDKIPKPVGEDQ